MRSFSYIFPFKSILVLLMEDWLKLMLEWDPTVRGRRYSDSSHPGPIVAFQMLDKMLKAEVASIFWAEGLTVLSYTVTDEISMEMVHQWIERDTGIIPQCQLLILPRGRTPDLEKSARQLLCCEEFENVCLFSKFNDGSECKITQIYPEFLEIMLANPREEFEYRIQKRMWSQSVFFIRHQATLYRKLMHALKIHSYDKSVCSSILLANDFFLFRRTYMTVNASLLKQQTDFVSGILRHATSSHAIFVSYYYYYVL